MCLYRSERAKLQKQIKDIGGHTMFNAPHCCYCGKKEHKNGYGCNNPKCKEYYKLKELLKDAQNIEQQALHPVPSQIELWLNGDEI